MKYKRIIIGIIVGIIIFGGCGFFFYNKAKKNSVLKKEPLVYGPVSNTVINYRVESIAEDYALIKKAGLFGVVDFNGEVVVNPTVNNVNSINVIGEKNKYLILERLGEEDLIYSTKGEQKLKSELIWALNIDPITQKEYFASDDSLYDENLNKIFSTTDKSIRVVVDNKIYYSNNKEDIDTIYVYDLTAPKKLNTIYKQGFHYLENYYFILGDSSIVVDIQDKKIIEYGKGYYDENNNKYVLDDNGKDVNYDSYGNKYNAKELTIFKYKNGLYSDNKECDYGSKLYSKSGKLLSLECHNYIGDDNYVYEEEYGSGITKIYNNKGTIVFTNTTRDNELYSNVWKDDFYIYYVKHYDNDKVISSIYDYDLNEYHPCKENEYISGSNGTIICSDAMNNYEYLTNINGEKKSDKYESINCTNNGVCMVRKGTMQGLFYNNELIVPISDKYSIDYSNDSILIKQLVQSNIIKFGNVRNSSQLLENIKIEEEKIELAQDIDEIIKEYNLEFEKEEIYENQEFFKKYAYIVFDNNQAEFNKYVLDLFKVVVDNKGLLNETAFLRDLSKLNIVLTNSLKIGSGMFSDGDNTITIESQDGSSIDHGTIYHELMHFVDYSMNTNEEKIYNCDGKFYQKSDVKNLNKCTSLFFSDSRLMVESGAEYYSSNYYDNYDINSYINGVAIYTVLEYIFGEKEMQKAFFSSNTEVELFKLFVLKAGLPIDEFEDFLKYGNYIVYEKIYEEYKDGADEAYSKILDMLIEMYENINKSKWEDDYVFRLLLSQIFGLSGYDTSDSTVLDRTAVSKNRVDFDQYLIHFNPYISGNLALYTGINSLRVDNYYDLRNLGGDPIIYDIAEDIGLTVDAKSNKICFIRDMVFRIVNNKPSVVISYELYDWDNNKTEKHIEKGTIMVNYDFEKKRVIDFKQIYKSNSKSS